VSSSSPLRPNPEAGITHADRSTLALREVATILRSLLYAELTGGCGSGHPGSIGLASSMGGAVMAALSLCSIHPSCVWSKLLPFSSRLVDWLPQSAAVSPYGIFLAQKRIEVHWRFYGHCLPRLPGNCHTAHPASCPTRLVRGQPKLSLTFEVFSTLCFFGLTLGMSFGF